jgi:hypothetical protein
MWKSSAKNPTLGDWDGQAYCAHMPPQAYVAHSDLSGEYARSSPGSFRSSMAHSLFIRFSLIKCLLSICGQFPSMKN